MSSAPYLTCLNENGLFPMVKNSSRREEDDEGDGQLDAYFIDATYYRLFDYQAQDLLGFLECYLVEPFRHRPTERLQILQRQSNSSFFLVQMAELFKGT